MHEKEKKTANALKCKPRAGSLLFPFLLVFVCVFLSYDVLGTVDVSHVCFMLLNANNLTVVEMFPDESRSLCTLRHIFDTYMLLFFFNKL